MTTVVATLELMVADHRVTSEGAICNIRKLHRIEDRIYGLAGEIGPAFAMLKWLREGTGKLEVLYAMFGEGVEARSSFSLLELSHDGLALWDGWGIRIPLLDKRYGIGTGAPAVLALIDRGIPPSDALKSSPILDECSGIASGFEVEEEYLLPRELTYPELLPKRKRRR